MVGMSRHGARVPGGRRIVLEAAKTSGELL
jgi:hypothetical protein